MRYRTIPALAVLALTGSLLAGCSSSATPSAGPSSAPPASTQAATATATTASAGGAVPAADCAVIKPIASGAIATLVPIQSESSTAAASAMGKYLTQLNKSLAQLASAQAKTDLQAFITALSQAKSAASQTAVTTALGKLTADCP